MSELKAKHAFDVYEDYTKTGDDDSAQVYIKADADKVIAELKEKHKTEVKELLCLIRDKENNFNRAFDSEEKEIRHHKYKRCLAMVETCIYKKELDEDRYHMHGGHGWTNYRFWDKWQKTWLELAEKFKTN